MMYLLAVLLLLANACTSTKHLLGPYIDVQSEQDEAELSGSGDPSSSQENQDPDGLPGINDDNGTLTFPGPTLPPNAITELSLPMCMENELLAFDGNTLFCRTIPERQCKCPGSDIGSGEGVTVGPTLVPEPPGGCLIFEPPKGGAFTCVSVDDFVIYCSVYCDNEHEFSTTPINPYFCGVPSNFEWKDFTNVEQDSLPACSGFRHTLRPLHPSEFYLPTKCENLNSTQVNQIKTEFCSLISFFTLMDCSIDDAFIQCPSTVKRKF